MTSDPISQSQTAKILVVGLPASGKSTFIGALFNVLEAGDESIACRWERMPDDASYAHELARAWIECRSPKRNSAGITQQVELHLTHRATDGTFDIVFPDVAGELFERQWQLRTMAPSYATDVKSASGIILFISPTNLVRAIPLRKDDSDMIALLSGSLGIVDSGVVELHSVPASADSGRDSGVNNTDITDNANDAAAMYSDFPTDSLAATPEQRRLVEVIARHPLRTPTQVILVELLQTILRLRAGLPLRLVIVISAWDAQLMVDASVTPQSWLESDVPLLAQFIEANSEHLPTLAFGISAQGGDYENPDELAHLQGHVTDYIARVIVSTNTGSKSHDITLPVAWIATGHA